MGPHYFSKPWVFSSTSGGGKSARAVLGYELRATRLVLGATKHLE